MNASFANTTKQRSLIFPNRIAEVHVTYQRATDVVDTDRHKITSSLDAIDILRSTWKNLLFQETFKTILLDRANRVLGIHIVSLGGVSGTSADP